MSLFSFAQNNFPNKAVNLIVPFPPGGAADQPSRLISQALFNVWQQPAVVFTKPGAGGAIGTAFVANAPADGYTLLATNPSMIIVPEADRMFSRPPTFDITNFSPLALLVADPIVLVVKADSPWKTYKDFIADAKAKPGEVTYGSSGAYSASHIPIEMLANAAGVKLRHIPFAGGGPAILAVLGGHISTTASSPAAVVNQIKSGALRALVVTGNKRLAALPEVPTAIELGYKDAEFYLWIGLFAPVKTPPDVLQTIRNDLNKAITQDNGFIQNMQKLGATTDYRDAPAFSEFLIKDAERIKSTMIKIGKVD
ncbi:tripartite tricarboxylate transporter substrate binding protein [Polynucleobacter rarus]|jgi:tripartite-type tricarboxylate transporter receptor subunit TctC|uniref:tripartite tricarboxylate transporter substrate binding protein n=1 Tax=Polynucleobacter rarus TaxID=556055 RepID=UPI00131F3664|nr:tripartite tricarboxylate transporter substrate binding protein [Polynucleobacter rarus]